MSKLQFVMANALKPGDVIHYSDIRWVVMPTWKTSPTAKLTRIQPMFPAEHWRGMHDAYLGPTALVGRYQGKAPESRMVFHGPKKKKLSSYRAGAPRVRKQQPVEVEE